MALILSIFAAWMLWLAGYVAGSNAKENSQLGQALSLMVRAPELDSVLADSKVTMRRLDTLAATATRRQRLPKPISAPQPLRVTPHALPLP